MTATRSAAALLPLAAALSLAACGNADPAEKNYEPDAVDVSEGELIVTDQTAAAVDVDTPDTPMTPYPEGETATPEAASTTPPAAAE